MANKVDGGSSGGVRLSRHPNRRRRIAVGAVGAAAVLGIGAYAVTSQVAGKDAVESRDTRVLAPVVSPTSELSPSALLPAPAVSPSMPSPTSAPVSPSARATSASASASASSRTSLAPKTRKRVDQALAAGAKNKKVPLTKALPPPRSKVLPAGAVKTRMEQDANGLVRITTAKGDLTDQKDHRMAGDDETKVGAVTCTQKLRFASNVAPKVFPATMICWRISKNRSVITMGVVKKGKPVASFYAKVISREWDRMS